MQDTSRLPASDPAEVVSLHVLLRRLGDELASLYDMAAEMEGAVDEMIERHAGVLEAEIIRKLQLLDILTQTLSALSTFSVHTAALVSPDWKVDGQGATASLKLASLAQRLARGVDRPAEAAGESYELFSDG